MACDASVMTKHIPVADLAQKLDALLAEVSSGKAEVVLEQDGKPVAVMVPVQEFENWQHKRQAAVSRFVERGRRAAKRVERQLKAKGKSWEELEQEIVEEVRAVRKARAQRKQEL